jgi:hypothetical protein
MEKGTDVKLSAGVLTLDDMMRQQEERKGQRERDGERESEENDTLIMLFEMLLKMRRRDHAIFEKIMAEILSNVIIPNLKESFGYDENKEY